MVILTIELSEAKDQLARLVDEVNAGAEVTLTRDGQPVARLVPPLADRVPGSAKGMFTVPDEFDPHLADCVPGSAKSLLTMSDDADTPLTDRVPGSAKGMVTMSDDFDAPLEDFQDYM